VHARTLESMHALGLTEQLVSLGHPMHAFRLVEDGAPIMHAKFTNIGSPYSFVLGLPQSRTERTLLNRLQNLGGNVEWNTRLLDIDQLGDVESLQQSACVRLQKADGSEELVSCNWLIGADGSRSSVREMAGIDFPGGDYGKAFILGDVRIDWDGPKHDLQFFLTADGYMLLVPMPNGMHRIIAQTDKKYQDFQGSEKPLATLAELQAIVDRQGPGNIRVHSPEWLTCAPFYHRRAETSVKGRTILVGDAFHLFSPLGAQGLNTGFQDAFNLAWKLAYIEKGWADVSLMQSYKQEREAIAKLISTVTTKTTNYITATKWHQRLARRVVTKWFNNTPRVQDQLPRLLAGLMQAYDSEGDLAGASASGLPAAGQRIPHAWIPDGQAYKPMAAVVHGTQYTMLLLKNRLDETALAKLDTFCREQKPLLPYLRVMVVTREISGWVGRLPAGVSIVEDRLGSVFDAVNVSDQALLLSRPDGFCAVSAHGWGLELVSGYFCEKGFEQVSAAANHTHEEYVHA
jgi:2-polyprenyl-6-methoxyphenol hydroxylase-like FAD-dependent oxidoreductase